ncbi:MAG: DNA polymerase III subunit beta [Cardiobacteriaceae bacterium]|nr:DNA polymerase III subunit beta [Cardiobacteriaceae bacterium]
MIFTIQQSALLPKLADVSSITERKSANPIFSHLLIEAHPNHLLLKGTDNEITLSVEVDESVHVQQTGAVTVPASKFLEVIRHQSSGSEIHCALEGEQWVVRSQDSIFRLSTLPAQDFPVLETFSLPDSLELSSKALHQLLKKVQFSMAEQDPRHYLQGVLLKVVEQGHALHAVSTDGHRLSCAMASLQQASNPEGSWILPRKAVAELIRFLSRLDQMVRLQVGGRHLNVELGGYRLTTSLIDGQFPQYEPVIPPKQPTPVLIPRQSLIEALQRARVLQMGRGNEGGVSLRFQEHELLLSARNSENETVEERLDILNPAKLSLDIGLNTHYLIQAIQHLESENVQLHLVNNTSPCLLTGQEDEDLRYIIMPLRL